MQRFWRRAEVAGMATGGFAVFLDDRPLRLPGGTPLVTSSAALAAAIAAEWQAAGGGEVGGVMTFAEIPLTRLLGTAQERIAPDPTPLIAALTRYGETDLLCYRAEEQALAALQEQQWQPWLDWAAEALAAPLSITAGLMPITQPAASIAALRRWVAAHGPEELAALGLAVPALGSLVLGLALSLRRIGAGEAFRLAMLDEAYQERRWGADPQALARRARIAAEVQLAERFLGLLRSP